MPLIFTMIFCLVSHVILGQFTFDRFKSKETLANEIEYLQKLQQYQVKNFPSTIRYRNQLDARLQYNSDPISFKISWIKMTIKDGQIDDINVSGTMNNGREITHMTFTNNFPIPFATKKNYNKINRAPIYNMYPSRNKAIYRLDLAQVINYIPDLSLNSYDYSPANGEYTIYIDKEYLPSEGFVERDFYKEPLSNLFKFRAYSDLGGLINNQPNGLIQIEFSRKVFTNHHYNSSFNYFAFWEPVFAITKIEEDDRRLFVRRDSSTPYNYTLNLFTHSNMSVGFNTNIARLFVSRYKMFFEINKHLSVHNIQFSNLVNNDTDTLNFSKRAYQFGGELRLKFRTHKQFNFDLGHQLTRFRLVNSDNSPFNEQVKQDLSSDDKKRFLMSWFLNLRVQANPSGNADVFVRAIYTKPLHDRLDNLRIEVGYAQSLTKVKNKPVKNQDAQD